MKGNFEYNLAFHCAPSLCGIKCGNLYAVKKGDFDAENYCTINSFLKKRNMRIRLLCAKKDRYLVFVYNKVLLKKQLTQPKCLNALRKAGYPEEFSCEKYIDQMAKKVITCENFPHEIGIFLGFPFEDVYGFIKNKGQNYKMCGLWKVYSDEKRAAHLFKSYEKCRKYLCNKIICGTELCDALGHLKSV